MILDVRTYVIFMLHHPTLSSEQHSLFYFFNHAMVLVLAVELHAQLLQGKNLLNLLSVVRRHLLD